MEWQENRPVRAVLIIEALWFGVLFAPMNLKKVEKIKDCMQGNRKAWFLVLFGALIAVFAFFILPASIPIHFSGGAPDQYAHKAWIFIFPISQAILLLAGETKPFRQWYMVQKQAAKSGTQYKALLFCVTLFLVLVEIAVLLFAV